MDFKKSFMEAPTIEKRLAIAFMVAVMDDGSYDELLSSVRDSEHRRGIQLMRKYGSDTEFLEAMSLFTPVSEPKLLQHVVELTGVEI